MKLAGGYYRHADGQWMTEVGDVPVTYEPVIEALDRLEELESTHDHAVEKLQSRIDRAIDKLTTMSGRCKALDILRGEDKPKTLREQIEDACTGGGSPFDAHLILADAIDALRADLDRRK